MFLTLEPVDRDEGPLGFIEGLRNPPRSFLDALERSIRQGFANNFSRQGLGGAWPHLAPSTARERARQGYPPHRPILVRDGQYRSSFTESRRGHSSFSRHSRGWTLHIGPGSALAAYHEHGTRNMPARPATGLENRDQAMVDAVFLRYLTLLERR